MTLEEEGAYLRLMCYCWREGSIPADPEKCLALLMKGGLTTVQRVVELCFVESPNDPSRLVHPRLEMEREKQNIWREKSRLGGIKSGKHRMLRKSKGGSSRPVEPNANSSSSSSSSSTPKAPNGNPEWHPNSEQEALNSLFGRRATTRWSAGELKAWQAITPIDASDLSALKRYYSSNIPDATDYRRHDLATLLNNFNGEVDRAKNLKEPKVW